MGGLLLAACASEPANPFDQSRADIIENVVDGDTPHEIEIDGQRYERVSQVRRISFGVVVLDSEGRTPALEFNLQGKIVGMSIVLKPESPDYVHVDELRDGNGKLLISNVAPAEHLTGFAQAFSLNPIWFSALREVSSAPLPSANPIDFSEGLWTLRAKSEAGAAAANTSMRVDVLVKEFVTDVTADTIDVLKLRLHVSPDNGVVDLSRAQQAMNAGRSPLDGSLASARDLFREHRIEMMVTGVEELDTRFAAQNLSDPASQGPNPEFTELMTAFPQNPGVLNTFFVAPTNATSYGGLGVFDGVAATFASGQNTMAGLIVNTRQPSQGPSVFAHELGHALALLHTDRDFFQDTFNYDHVLNGDESAGHTPAEVIDNLMTPGGGLMELSERQVAAIRSRPGLTTYQRVTP